MAKKIRGVMFEENLKNSMGLEFYDLSHRFGSRSPNWPYFEDVKIERLHGMSKSGVLTQRITTVDAFRHAHRRACACRSGHAVHGRSAAAPISSAPASSSRSRRRSGKSITADDLEKARPQIREDDIVIVNTGWHKYYERQPALLRLLAGLLQRGRRMVREEEGQDGRSPTRRRSTIRWALRSARTAPARRNGLLPKINQEYEELTGRKVIEDFPEWEPVPQRDPVGTASAASRTSAATSTRSPASACTFAAFPWR